MNPISIGTIAGAALYLIASYLKFGMTTSISQTRERWYEHNYSELFTVFCTWVTLGAWLETLFLTKHESKLLIVFAGFFMFCVAIASLYKIKRVALWHYAAAGLAILLGFAALSVEFWGTWKSWVPLIVFVALSVATRLKWPSVATYLIECYAVAFIFGCQ